MIKSRKPKKVVFPARVRKSIVLMLKYYIGVTGMLQQDLALMLGVADSHISNILQGRNNASLKVRKAMHKEMKIDGNLLLEID